MTEAGIEQLCCVLGTAWSQKTLAYLLLQFAHGLYDLWVHERSCICYHSS